MATQHPKVFFSKRSNRFHMVTTKLSQCRFAISFMSDLLLDFDQFISRKILNFLDLCASKSSFVVTDGLFLNGFHFVTSKYLNVIRSRCLRGTFHS